MLPRKFQIIAKIDEKDEFLSENGQIGLKKRVAFFVTLFLSDVYWFGNDCWFRDVHKV